MQSDSALKPALGLDSTDRDKHAAAFKRERPWWRFFVTNEFGLIVLVIVFAAIFSVVTPGFTSRFSLYALGRTMAIDAVIGFSMMVVIVTGGLNLSIGAIGVCAVMFAGWLLERAGLRWRALWGRRPRWAAAVGLGWLRTGRGVWPTG